MRFIVDAYRFIVLLFLALALVGGSYLVFSILLGTGAQSQFGELAILWFFVTAIVVILTMGMTATFISIHDRLVDISDHSKRIADALERSDSVPR